MNLGNKLIECLIVWAFWSTVGFIFTPSKQEAIALSVVLAGLFLFAFLILLAITLIARSLNRLSSGIDKKIPHK